MSETTKDLVTTVYKMSYKKKRKSNHHQPIPICEMDSSSLCDVAFAMASGSSRGKGNTSLTHRKDAD